MNNTHENSKLIPSTFPKRYISIFFFKVKSVTQIELSEELKCIYVSGFVSDIIRNKLELCFCIENNFCFVLYIVGTSSGIYKGMCMAGSLQTSK